MSKTDDYSSTFMRRAITTAKTCASAPVVWLHDNVLLSLRPKERPVFYHQRFRRVPTIDECDICDEVCKYEANEQFMRDKEVDSQILNILKERYGECKLYAGVDSEHHCRNIFEEYQKASADWFTKYGDLGVTGGAVEAYMKQKHRMIYERQHGTHLRE